MSNPEIQALSVDHLQQLEDLKSQLQHALVEGSQNGDLTAALKLQAEIDAEMAAAKEDLCPYPAYLIKVNFDQTVDSLLAPCHFAYVDYDLANTARPQLTGQPLLKIRLFKFNDAIFSHQIIQAMDQYNLRPVNLYELVTLHYYLNTNFATARVPLVGLTVGQREDGRVPLIRQTRYSSGYSLTAGHEYVRWGQSAYFPAVKNN